MSTYIIDNRSIDYLVAWWLLLSRGRQYPVVVHPEAFDYGVIATQHPAAFSRTLLGDDCYVVRFHPALVSPDVIGGILVAENYRSVNHRYQEVEAPAEPYRFRPVPTEQLRPEWVIGVANCLLYQIGETPDYRETIAFGLVHGIRESAIDTICLRAGAPGEISENEVGLAAVPESRRSRSARTVRVMSTPEGK